MIQDAKIRWFDRLSGQGLVRLNTGESIYIHWTAIVNPKLYGWDLQDDKIQAMLSDVIPSADCYVNVHRDSHYNQINLCIIK
jgi:hypothetical protein